MMDHLIPQTKHTLDYLRMRRTARSLARSTDDLTTYSHREGSRYIAEIHVPGTNVPDHGSGTTWYEHRKKLGRCGSGT